MLFESDRVHEWHVETDRVPTDTFVDPLWGHVVEHLGKVRVWIFLEVDHVHVSIGQGSQDIGQPPAELVGWGRIVEVLDALGVLEIGHQLAIGTGSQGNIVSHTRLKEGGSRAGVGVRLDLLVVEHEGSGVELDQAESSTWL